MFLCNEYFLSHFNKISTIFQEPMTSLNPLHTINKQIEEIILTHNKIPYLEAKKKTENLLKEVGLDQEIQKLQSYKLITVSLLFDL